MASAQSPFTTGMSSEQINAVIAVEAPKLANRIHAQLKRERLVLVLSGGAPHSPLMAGALCALQDKIGQKLNGGKGHFDAIYTAGGGALVGLLFVAPKGVKSSQALRDLVKMGIADPIYKMLQLAYKTFFKPGPLVPLFREWAGMFKQGTSHLHLYRAAVTAGLKFWGGPSLAKQPQWGEFGQDDPDRRLYDDWVDLVFTALAPTTLTPWSTGLCEPVPFVEDLVDFGALKKYKGQFYLNAYNLTEGVPQRFTRGEIDAAHVRAAFAYPFIYPPGRIGETFYTEGASHDPVLLPQDHDPRFPEGTDDPVAFQWFKVIETAFTKHLKEKELMDPRGRIVYIDILGSLGKSVLRKPRDLWDAYGLSMIAPIVELARKDRALFSNVDNERLFLGHYDLLPVSFDLKDVGPRVLDWNYSNLCDLWDIGYDAGNTFCEKKENRDALCLSSEKSS